MKTSSAGTKVLSLLFAVLFFVSGCGMPENHLNTYQRSMVVENGKDEARVLSNAQVSFVDLQQHVRVLVLKGTPYEMGFQHGKLCAWEINEFYRKVIFRIKFFAREDMFDEIYDLMDPYIPSEEKEEMRGLAHGAGVPLRVVHWIHAIPEVSEYGEKRKFRRYFKATSCSSIVAFGSATADGTLYHLRVLDWIRELGAQRSPVVLVHRPDRGNASVTFSYAGFIGCISGMNDKQMSFGEMGYGDPPGERLEGTPFIFLFRKLMREANTLADAERIIRTTTRTCSYIYVIADAKGREPKDKAALFVTDRGRVVTIHENTDLKDERDSEAYPGLSRIVYGGAKAVPLHENLARYRGAITPEILMSITKDIALGSNMQNVIFAPATFEAWISNASMEKGDRGRACNQQWFHISLEKFLKN